MKCNCNQFLVIINNKFGACLTQGQIAEAAARYYEENSK